MSVGIRPPHSLFDGGLERLRAVVRRAEELELDQLCVGDHVTFRGGRGFDGLVLAGMLVALGERIPVHTTVYLLPLRHPVPVARQIVSLVSLAPGRLVFGVGIAGEDPAEVEACGVDPHTRGRRMDESLDVLRALLAGETVTRDGEFFPLRDVLVVPTPNPPVPILVGGRSEAALRRAALRGEGWLGVFVSPSRFASATGQIEEAAAAAGRTDVDWRHGLQVWCGFGTTSEEATPRLAAALEEMYRLPFSGFDRYAPRGTPEDVAAALEPYVASGCRNFNIIPVASDPERAIEHVASVRRHLLGTE